MKTKLTIFLTTAGLLLAIIGSGSAASRRHRAADAYASGAATHEMIPSASGRSWNGTRFPTSTAAEPFGPGRNLPYPDRPYGDPGRW